MRVLILFLCSGVFLSGCAAPAAKKAKPSCCAAINVSAYIVSQ
ncbi:MAG: hypothetical protein WCO60_15745 [Verrucomicrobiota bacterium]